MAKQQTSCHMELLLLVESASTNQQPKAKPNNKTQASAQSAGR